MKKALLIVALLGAVGYGGYRMLGGGERDQPTAQDSEQLTLGRVWIDHIPRSDKETVQVFLAIPDEPFGVFQAASAWRGQYEIFQYEATSSELRLHYPQTNQRETVKHRARRCNENQMDFCLELDGGSRGVKRYYSRKGWEIEGVKTVDELRTRTDAVLHALTK